MAAENEWNEKLFGCTDDCGVCCYGWCCTPCLFGSNAKKIDDQNCFLCCCAYTLLGNFSLCWIPHYMEREKLRKKYNLKEGDCGDCPTAFFCSPCALCQEAREMKSRENPRGVAVTSNNNVPIVSQPGVQEKTVNMGV